MSFISDLIGGIFGGGDSGDTPDPTALPKDPRKDPMVQGALRKAAMLQRKRSTRGRASTILTPPNGGTP